MIRNIYGNSGNKLKKRIYYDIQNEVVTILSNIYDSNLLSSEKEEIENIKKINNVIDVLDFFLKLKNNLESMNHSCNIMNLFIKNISKFNFNESILYSFKNCLLIFKNMQDNVEINCTILISNYIIPPLKYFIGLTLEIKEELFNRIKNKYMNIASFLLIDFFKEIEFKYLEFIQKGCDFIQNLLDLQQLINLLRDLMNLKYNDNDYLVEIFKEINKLKINFNMDFILDYTQLEVLLILHDEEIKKNLIFAFKNEMKSTFNKINNNYESFIIKYVNLMVNKVKNIVIRLHYYQINSIMVDFYDEECLYLLEKIIQNDKIVENLKNFSKECSLSINVNEYFMAFESLESEKNLENIFNKVRIEIIKIFVEFKNKLIIIQIFKIITT